MRPGQVDVVPVRGFRQIGGEVVLVLLPGRIVADDHGIPPGVPAIGRPVDAKTVYKLRSRYTDHAVIGEVTIIEVSLSIEREARIPPGPRRKELLRPGQAPVCGCICVADIGGGGNIQRIDRIDRDRYFLRRIEIPGDRRAHPDVQRLGVNRPGHE